MQEIKLSAMSYDEYKTILGNVIATGRYCDFSDVQHGKPFVVLRHDVEFSPERALAIQKIENEFDFKSSYFFQITNNVYSAFSWKNIAIIKEIHANGHHIGLHYHRGGKTDIAEIAADIKKQAEIMSDMLGIAIDRFSFHRPMGEELSANIEIDNLINTYSPSFFTYVPEMNDKAKLKVKYIADSNHRWFYGYPDDEVFASYQCIQILIHPYSWTPTGFNNMNNFKSLIAEKNMELIESIDSECRHFAEVRNEL